MDYVPALARWIHLLAGVMWIGLLYYFNFVQVPALKAAAADGTAAGITKHVAPRALLYFRWSAVVTPRRSSVSIVPGAIALILMLYGAASYAACRVRPITPALAAL